MDTLDAALRAGQAQLGQAVGLDDDLRDEHGMDSLDAVEIILWVEEELGVEIDWRRVGEYRTLRELGERVGQLR